MNTTVSTDQSLDVEKICRVCLQSNLDLFLIFDENYSEDGVTLSSMLSECTIYKVKRFDEFPHLICLNCMDNAKNAFKFKKQCEKSYRYLIDVLSTTKPTFEDPNKTDNILVEKETQTDTSTFYPCEKCDEKFFNYEGLKEHRINMHKGTANKCRFCSKEFIRINHLKGHIAMHHPESGRSYSNACTICKKQFSRKDHIKRHMINVHKIEFPKVIEKNSLDEPEIEYKIEANEEHNIDGVILSDNDPTSMPNQSSSSSSSSVCDSSGEVNEENVKDSKTNSDIDQKSNAKILVHSKIVNFFHKTEDKVENTKEDEENIKPLILPIPPITHEVLCDIPKFDDLQETIKIEKELEPISFSNTIEEVNFSMDDSLYPLVKVNEQESRSKSKVIKNINKRSNNLVKKKHVCPQCERVFACNGHLKRHLLSHGDEKPFVCSVCSKRFKRSDHLKIHLTLHREAHLQCDECGKPFRRRDKLSEHKRLKHSSNLTKSEICDICQKGFSTKSYLRRHLQAHFEEKHYKCRNCELNFTSREHLKEHVKTHKKIKPFLCSECGASFLRNDYLLIHMRRHKGEKPYKCKFCNKGFPRATDLNIHVKYHTGEKPHLCTVCGKGFPRGYNLVVHMRTHTGERPYKCSHCPSSFAQGNDLKAHIRRHTGERFKCTICGDGFIQGYNLTQHMSVAHGIQVKPRNGGRVTKFPLQHQQVPNLITESFNPDTISKASFPVETNSIQNKEQKDEPFNLSLTEHPVKSEQFSNS